MLAVVTNYYNPDGRASKQQNYERFLEGMRGLPLYVIEAAFGGEPFRLAPADNVIQVRCPHLMWQQYTLVNRVIRQLPDRFDKAVWVDADILMEDGWHARMDEMLGQYKVVQSYKTVDLSKGNGGWDVRESVTHVAMVNAKKPTATIMSGNLDLSSKFASGFSWGVQRDVIEKHGVYDYWITGSCDTAFVIGIWGDWKNAFLKRLNPRMLEHYMGWAVPFNEYVGGSVSYLDAHIRHLWHGHRNYRKRWRCLGDLDPYVDLRVNGDGVLEWCSDKPEMHECCRKMCLDYEIDFNPYL